MPTTVKVQSVRLPEEDHARLLGLIEYIKDKTGASVNIQDLIRKAVAGFYSEEEVDRLTRELLVWPRPRTSAD